MTVRLTPDLSRLDAEWRVVLDAVRTGTRRAAGLAREHAGERMITYLTDMVYATQPGNVYDRTERALDELRSYLDPDAREGDFILTLESGAEYAAQIEQGNELDYFEQRSGRLGTPSSDEFIPRVTLDEIAALSDSLAEDGVDPHPRVFFERSGQDYQVPGPHAVPAAVAGAWRFHDLVEEAWARASRLT